MADRIIEFIGVYDADSTVIGEVSYWIKARFGAAHCALCDITHGLFAPKREWKECSLSLSVPFRTHHRNDAPDDVLRAAPGFPVVMARRENGLETVFDRHDLDAFDGSASAFVQALTRRLGS